MTTIVVVAAVDDKDEADNDAMIGLWYTRLDFTTRHELLATDCISQDLCIVCLYY